MKNAAGNRSASRVTVARTAALRLRDVMTLPFVVFFIFRPTRLLPSLNLVPEPFNQPNRHGQFLACPLTITFPSFH
jgi:hypothetical protein